MGEDRSDAPPRESRLVQVVSGLVGETAAPNSANHAAARALQAIRFASASKPRRVAEPDVSYLQAVEFADTRTICLVASRERSGRAKGVASMRGAPAGPVIGTVRLELPGASIVENLVRFAPTSAADAVRARGRFLEIGGFAAAPELSRGEVIDVIDTLAATIVAVARQYGTECFWMFPRLPVMRLFLAEIDDLLPAYRFELCRDVTGWVVGSPRLEALRRLDLKEFETSPVARPVVYATSFDTLAADLACRLVARSSRVGTPEVEKRLGEAMLQAYRRVRSDVRRYQREGRGAPCAPHHCLPPPPAAAQSSPLDLDDLRPRRGAREPAVRPPPSHPSRPLFDPRTPQVGVEGGVPGAHQVAHEPGGEHLSASSREGNTVSSGKSEPSFLPYVAEPQQRTQVLESIVAGGGEAVARYKRQTYSLLGVYAGMRVLDVGCGSGVDLAPLAALVGPAGAVVGLDHDEVVLDAARARLNLGPTRGGAAPAPLTSSGGTGGSPATDHRAPISVVAGDAERLPFADASFDRVRADRVLQHVLDPARALAEMYRVLVPGGSAVLSEPDWKTIAIHPGSIEGGDDDHTLAAVLGHYQRVLPHALVGRQLPALLRRAPSPGWEEVSAEAVAFTLTSVAVVDLVMQLTPTARALAAERAQLAQEIEGWLSAMARAEAEGSFWAILPLVFVVARKPAP
jgi:SAM-dependent methyltransferase